MTFKQLVWKMARVNKRRYIFYFLCNSFAVFFFFIFATIYLNEHIVAVKELEGVKDALIIPAVALIVFTVFFISYAHEIFMKQRRKEFGLFMTLGMTSKNITKLLLLENIVIAILSVATGIIGGVVFSRLFFLLLMYSIDMQVVPFHLNIEMFLYTTGAFIAVFTVAVGKSLIMILLGNIIDIVKSDRVAEKIKLRSPLLGGIGLAIMVASIFFLYYTYATALDAGSLLLFWTITLLVGLYISLNQFTSFFLKLAKKNKRFYYKKLLFLTSIDYKFKQLTSIMMLVSVMVMITIFYSSLLLFMNKSAIDQAMEWNPYDVAYIQTETKNNISNEEVFSIVDGPDHRIQEYMTIPFFYYFKQHEHWPDAYIQHVFISLESFNTLTSNKIDLKENEYIYYINQKEEYAYSNSDYDRGLSFAFGDEQVAYQLIETVTSKKINNLSYMYDILVLHDAQYERLKHELPDTLEANVHLIQTSNWKNTSEAVGKLSDRFKEYNATTLPIDHMVLEYTTEEDLFRVASKVEDYLYNKNASGIMFFVTTFLSIIFFIGTFILLYLSIFMDMNKEKIKYSKLFKIGITSKEIKRMVASELKVLFFTSTTIGTVLAFLYIVILATDIGGIMKSPSLLLNFLMIAVIYQIIQLIYYFYAKKKMLLHLGI